MKMGYSSAAQSGIREELGLSVAAYSLFGSIMTLGGTIGALFSGKTASLFGRRHTMWFSELFCTLGWLIIALAKDARWLDIGRFLLGIGVGFVTYVVPVYIAEITPKNIRGACTFANQLMQNCGLSLMYITGNFVSWRPLALIGAIPCAVQLIGLFFVPESARWLAKLGRQKEFEIALQRLRGKDVDISEEVATIREGMETVDDSNSGIRHLFQKKYAHALTVGIGLMLLQQFSGCSGVALYASSIFEQAGFPINIGTTTLALIMVPKAVLGLFLVDRWGRRPLLMASASGMCLCCILLGISFSLKAANHFPELTPILAFMGVLGYIMTFAVGFGGLPWIIMCEIFPINVKVSAGSLVTLANWSTGWIIAYFFNFMLEWSPAGTFFIFAGACGVTIAFVYTLVPETKGLTLEEIQRASIITLSPIIIPKVNK